MGVVHGYADLEVVDAAATLAQGVGEDDRVADTPGIVLLRVPLHDPAFDDAMLEAIEADLGMATGEAALGRNPLARPDVVHVVAVEPLYVDGVEGVLHGLQPVAGKQGGADLTYHVSPNVKVVAR